MAITRLGLHGPAAAYPGFSPKSEAEITVADPTVITVAADDRAIVVAAEGRSIVVPAKGTT